MISAQNSKIKAASLKTYNFGIPAFRSASGMVTCPSAGKCAKGCYARQGMFVFSVVKNAYERRLDATMAQGFVEYMTFEIRSLRTQAYRWNDSGDFYSRDYLDKVIEIAKATPDVIHYAYSKQVELVKSVKLPNNFIVIFSYGGKQDKLIKKSDRHARVFGSLQELLLAGYVNASEDDSLAIGKSKKIGLVYHGAASKKWES